MRRIFSYNLALLFYFLQGKTLSIPYASNRIPKETLDSMVANLEDLANDSKQPLFNKEVQNGLYIVSVEEPQKHVLKDYLQKYCTELVNNRLLTLDTKVFDWNVAREKFIKREAQFNLNCFITHNIYDMPQLAPELIKLHDNGGYKLEIEINHATECISERNFSFKCSLNLSSIVDKQEKSKPKTSVSQQQSKEANSSKNKFTKSDMKLIRLIQERIINGNDSTITLDDIEQIYSMKRESKARTPLTTRASNNICKLNARFKKATGKNILKLQEPYQVQIDEINLNYDGLDYEIIATLEDINIAFDLSSNTLE